MFVSANAGYLTSLVFKDRLWVGARKKQMLWAPAGCDTSLLTWLAAASQFEAHAAIPVFCAPVFDGL